MTTNATKVKTTRLDHDAYRKAAGDAIVWGEVHHGLIEPNAEVFDEMPKELQPTHAGKPQRGAYVEVRVWVDEKFARAAARKG